VFAAAAATVVALSLVTLLMFGSASWIAFWHSMALTQGIVLEQGATGFHKMQSVFAGLRLIGLSVGVAYCAQALTALCLAVGVVALWRGPAAFELKAAGLILASLLATPYALDYDLVILAPALAFLAVHGMREGFAPYEIALLVLVWTLPLFARSLAAVTLVATGPLALAALFLLVLHRAHVLPSLAVLLPKVSGRPGTAA
jgi:alpha-1,2-mannosyltransferase